jgi:flagellar basal-body rod protein FlgG
MLEGLYAAAAGMAADQQQIDSVSNDIANINTSGYKAVRVGFHDLLYTQTASQTGGSVLDGSGAASSLIGFNESQGAVDTTGNPLDVAINGPGFLQVKRPDGTIGLTRNGTLSINANRQLTANGGELVEPPVTVPPGVSDQSLEIAQDGTVGVNGKTIGKIVLVNVTAPDQLLADGTGLLSPTTASGAPKATTTATTQLQQGALESSNVDLAQDMTTMMSTQQSYSIASQAIQIEDQMQQVVNGMRQ